jgi:hypothetical protein
MILTVIYLEVLVDSFGRLICRTKIFSPGSILHELLTFTVPFDGWAFASGAAGGFTGRQPVTRRKDARLPLVRNLPDHHSGPHYLYRPRPGVKACLNCKKPAA